MAHGPPTERKLAAEQVGVAQRVGQRDGRKAQPARKARALRRPAKDLVPAARGGLRA